MQKTKNTKSAKIVFILILLALAALSLFLFLNLNQREEKKAAISLEQERQKWQDKVNVLEEQLASEKQAPASVPTMESQESALDTAAYKEIATEAVPTDPCQVTAERIDQFFSHLDNQDYFAEFQLEGGAKVYFSKMIAKLLASAPKITRETDSLLSILQNTAHFYRIIGDQNIFIMKKVMAHEKNLIEPAMADFFTLMSHGKNCLHLEYPIQMPLAKMYNYSVFFLNTLGGQAYLSRRQLSLRTLTKYYCILVLDLANEKQANTLGVDIRYPIKNLIEEMRVVPDLEDREKYLETLFSLEEKYEKKYGE